MKAALKLLQDIVTIPTAPFREQRVNRFLLDFARRYGIAVGEDRAGNVIYTYRQGRVKRPLFLEAHTDHPALEILETSGGVARARVNGGLFGSCFHAGAKFDLFAADPEAPAVPLGVGVITAHQTEKRPYSVTLQVPARAGLRRGDFGMVHVGAYRRRRGVLFNRVFDDLGGVAAIAELFRDVAKRKPRNLHVIGLLARAEEVGFVGSAEYLHTKKLPRGTVAISIECSKALPFGGESGKGVILRLADRRTVFNGGVSSYMNEVALRLQERDKRFQYQRRLMDGGVCEGSLFTAHGYDTGALALPLLHYHNNGGDRFAAEGIDERDYVSLCLYLRALAEGIGGMDAWLGDGLQRETRSHRESRHRLYRYP